MKTALIHLQFETIHPFLDGNGRIGRLLPEPLMVLSGYLKQRQAEYYRRLSNVRTEGDWEGWVAFFLEGVASLLAAPKAGPSSYRLFEMLPMMPRFTIDQVRQRLATSFPTATAAVKVLGDLGIVTELTGQKKNRSYSYTAYIALLAE